jgi:hypothetical protein
VVEGVGVPSEQPTRPQGRGDALERAPAVGPGRHVQQRAERAVDQRGGLVDAQLAHVGLVQVEFHPSAVGADAGLVEHRR